jgi:hypothetical protein
MRFTAGCIQPPPVSTTLPTRVGAPHHEPLALLFAQVEL